MEAFCIHQTSRPTCSDTNLFIGYIILLLPVVFSDMNDNNKLAVSQITVIEQNLSSK